LHSGHDDAVLAVGIFLCGLFLADRRAGRFVSRRRASPLHNHYSLAPHGYKISAALQARERSMASQAPYSINLNAKFGPLELVDLNPLVKACQDKWYNQTLCKVNDCVVRLGIMEGEFHWHKHDNEDEFFYVVDGRFLIDLEDRTVELMPKQGFTVPRGVVHRTRAPEKTVILMIEGAGVVPTGS
jgi:mannose-6-phosphate isomerase-like protein (cupin superfamily)